MAGNQVETRRQELEQREGIFPKYAYGAKPNLKDVSGLYARLDKNAPAEVHEEYYAAAEKLLLDAVSEYHAVVSQPDVTEEADAVASHRLAHAIEQARNLTFPRTALTSLSHNFIDIAFNTEREIPDHVRAAVVGIGAAIGGEDDIVVDNKVHYVANKHLHLKENQGKTPDETQREKLTIAKSLFDSMGVGEVSPAQSRFPSRKVALTGVAAAVASAVVLNPAMAHASEKDKEPNNTQVAVGNTATAPLSEEKVSKKAEPVVVDAVAEPDAEKAKENTPEIKPVVAAPVEAEVEVPATEQPETPAPETSAPETPEASTPAPQTPEAATPDEAKDKEKDQEKDQDKSQSQPETPVDGEAGSNEETGNNEKKDENKPKIVNAVPDPETPTPQEFNVPVGAQEKEGKKEAAPDPVVVSAVPEVAAPAPEILVAVGENGEAPEPTVVSVVAPEEAKAGSIDAVVGPLLDENGDEVKVKPSVVSAKPDILITELESKTATPEQLAALEKINYAIMGDRDLAIAADLIRSTFGEAKNGQPAEDTANPDLLKHIVGSNKEAIEGIKNKFTGQLNNVNFHGNAHYIGSSMKALAVLEAAAHDPSVLDSPDIQALIASAKAPDDPYQAKLYAQHLGAANKVFAENEGLLLQGFTSDAQKTRIQELYAYATLANVSDAEQGKQIDAIKKQEAEEAARKAAGMTDIEAIAADPNRLLIAGIERAAQAHGWSHSKMMFHKILAEMGTPLVAISAMSGNVDVESAGFNPSILEKGFENNPNRGLGFVQYTNYMGEGVELDGNGQAIGGRRTVYEHAARAAGFDPRNDTSDAFIRWQIEYIVAESKSRPERDGDGNEWAGFVSIQNPKEAAYFWQRNFERAGIPHNEAREASAQASFDQINGQIAGIQKDAADAKAAREAAEKAEAERKASRGMNIDEANAFMNHYKNSPDSIHHLGGAGRGCTGGPLSNCVSFSTWYINTQSGLKTFDATDGSENPGDGQQVAFRLNERSGVPLGHTPKPGAVWSYSDGSYGHTGVVLGLTEDGKVITGEAFCSGGLDRDGVYIRDAAMWFNGGVTYAYLK